ncbi:MAG: hypothetical protein ACMVO5_10150 [Polymorphobacter sp.]|uniref:hypothetical protein n=1 Tax=Polymorphobacter sp. TaxID=1909290 RepID=UPI003A8BBF66
MRALVLTASLLGLSSLAAPAAAAPWEVIVNPYFMAPYSDGKFGVGELQTNIGSSPADVFSKLNWGVMGAVEVSNDDWSLVLDANYLNIDVTNDDTRNILLNGHQAAYTVMLMKRIDPRAEIYVGYKVTDFGLQLDCNTVCPQPLDGAVPTPGLTGASRNRSWHEPLVGIRFRSELSEKWDVMVMADVGGFSVGSDISANVWPQIGYRIGKGASLLAGYRLIYVQYDEGEGRERFLFDAVTHGPTLGLEFRF